MKKLILIAGLLLIASNGWAEDNDLPPDGTLISYHSNGQVRLTGEVKDRKKLGVWDYYYDNGKLTELVQYNYTGSLSKLSALLSMSENTYMIHNYYPNGQIQSAGRVRQREEGGEDKYGIWIIYDEQGFVRQEKSYN